MVILKFQIVFTDRTDKERKIAAAISSHSCKSGFVKDVLWGYLNRDQFVSSVSNLNLFDDEN